MNLMDSPVGFLFKRPAILVVFVLITSVNAVLAGMVGDSRESWMVGIMAVLTYGVLALLTHRRMKLATIALVFIMLFNGMGSLFEAFRNLIVDPTHQTFMNGAALVAGAYMIAGGLIIFAGRNNRD